MEHARTFQRMNSEDLRRAVAAAVPPRPPIPFADRQESIDTYPTGDVSLLSKALSAAPDSGAESDSPPMLSSGMNSPAVPGWNKARTKDGLLLSTTPFVYGYDLIASPRSVSRTGTPAPPPATNGAAVPTGCEWRGGKVRSSQHAANTVNAIRRIVDVMSVEPNPKKTLVKLQLGDPTLTGTLVPHQAIKQAMLDSVTSGRHDGYGPAVGTAEARIAVAQYASTPDVPVCADDIILTSGCSHALQLAIEAVADKGHNILVPCPGFPLYTTLMRPHGIQDRHYKLIAERGWEVDLEQLETLVDSNTRAIVINNPSNPCGAVYSKEHLEALLRFAARHSLIVIADEIYGDMVYDGAEFHPLATLQPRVPILCCDGISKRYLVPGWRLGWLIVHDPCNGAMKHIRDGLRNLAQKIVGPCGIVQGALPSILQDTPEEFFDSTREVLQRASHAAFEELSQAPGLRPVRPYGAMYMFVTVDIKAFPEFRGNELELIKALIAEESVYCLPGSAFHHKHSFRVVLTYEEDVTRDACRRIREFCQRHYLPAPKRKTLQQSVPMSVTPESEKEQPLSINHVR